VGIILVRVYLKFFLRCFGQSFQMGGGGVCERWVLGDKALLVGSKNSEQKTTSKARRNIGHARLTR